MSSARGLANHSLYLARLVLDGWGQAEDRQQVPARVLQQAFGPACHAHLRQAYGWFLLALTRPDALPASPPAAVAELPAQPEGRAVPGEIREFEALEREGWLATLLHWQAEGPAQAPTLPGNLARPAPSAAGRDAFAEWLDQLDRLFQRMGDSLEEY